jgi:hypothetical protein
MISIIIRVIRSGNNNKRMVIIRVIVEVNDKRKSYDAEDAMAARTAKAGEPSHLVLDELSDCRAHVLHTRLAAQDLHGPGKLPHLYTPHPQHKYRTPINTGARPEIRRSANKKKADVIGEFQTDLTVYVSGVKFLRKYYFLIPSYFRTATCTQVYKHE